MLRAKRRRTRMYDNKGNIIYNTYNATSKQNYYTMKNNYLLSKKYSKLNNHKGCKRFYTEEEIITEYDNYVLDGELTIKVSNYNFILDEGCSSSIFGSNKILNASSFNGKYVNLKKNIYYSKNFVNDTDNKNHVIFLLYNTNQVTWVIVPIQFDATYTSIKSFAEAYYNQGIIGSLQSSSVNNICGVLYLNGIGLPFIKTILDAEKLTWNDAGSFTTQDININIEPDYKHITAFSVREKKFSTYCKTSSVPLNPLKGYRKQLVTENCIKKTNITSLTLNITNEKLSNLFKQVGIDYFNKPIDFSGEYEIINKNIEIIDGKFNIIYKKKFRKATNENYVLGYYKIKPTNMITFNGWYLRYYNSKNPDIIVDYAFIVDDNVKNELLINSLENVKYNYFMLNANNNKILNKGFIGLIDNNVSINIGDNIKLEDNGNIWSGKIYYVQSVEKYNMTLFYIGNISTPPNISFPYEQTKITINNNNSINKDIDYLLVEFDSINTSNFNFTNIDYQNYCDDIIVKSQPMKTIYKDNYAKTCGAFRKDNSNIGKLCGYSNVISSKQNTKGIVDSSYNYTSAQYYSRRNCITTDKKSNGKYYSDGATSGGSRINRLKYQTLIKSQQRFTNKLSNNKVNGRYPTTLYKDTHPFYKKNLFGLIKCGIRTKNGLLQNCSIKK